MLEEQFVREGISPGDARIAASRRFGNRTAAVEPFDAATLAYTGLGILIILCAAVWLPARRVSRVDPQIALRYE
jgi:ABC-type antimicrobial peptide transport system permease subunit